ncbi:hypothetical protein PPYR_08197 [Photinus pyralis]|uniref:Uncharacterized protein n=1 Tax=Photinus pyralis TaxID=7054 RepID=A0A1Y1MNM2_PHOPY|nr:hypothetical protein PPYR_08197 [Photinus pyralis]
MFWFITIVTFLRCYLENITKPLFRWILKASNYERNLYNTREEYKSLQCKLNLVDNFAKYSKIQRKINALDEELQVLYQTRRRSGYFYKTIIEYSLKAIFVVTLTFCSIWYRHTPAIILNKQFDLFPFSSLISFPIDSMNCISVPFWIVCCSTMGSVTKSFLSNFV